MYTEKRQKELKIMKLQQSQLSKSLICNSQQSDYGNFQKFQLFDTEYFLETEIADKDAENLLFQDYLNSGEKLNYANAQQKESADIAEIDQNQKLKQTSQVKDISQKQQIEINELQFQSGQSNIHRKLQNGNQGNKSSSMNQSFNIRSLQKNSELQSENDFSFQQDSKIEDNIECAQILQEIEEYLVKLISDQLLQKQLLQGFNENEQTQKLIGMLFDLISDSQQSSNEVRKEFIQNFMNNIEQSLLQIQSSVQQLVQNSFQRELFEKFNLQLQSFFDEYMTQTQQDSIIQFLKLLQNIANLAEASWNFQQLNQSQNNKQNLNGNGQEQNKSQMNENENFPSSRRNVGDIQQQKEASNHSTKRTQDRESQNMTLETIPSESFSPNFQTQPSASGKISFVDYLKTKIFEEYQQVQQIKCEERNQKVLNEMTKSRSISKRYTWIQSYQKLKNRQKQEKVTQYKNEQAFVELLDQIWTVLNESIRHWQSTQKIVQLCQEMQIDRKRILELSSKN